MLYQSIRRDARIGYALVCIYPDIASRHGYFTQIGHYNPRKLDESHVKSVLTSFEQIGVLNKVAEHSVSFTVDRSTLSTSWQSKQRVVDKDTPLLPQSADASDIPLLDIAPSLEGALAPLFLFAGQHRLQAARRHYAPLHEAYAESVRAIEGLDGSSEEDTAKLQNLQQIAEQQLRNLEENAVWLAEILDKGTLTPLQFSPHSVHPLIDWDEWRSDAYV